MSVKLLAAACALVAGCFSPTLPPCAVRCGADDACPDGLVCAAEGLCTAPGVSCVGLDADLQARDATEVGDAASDATAADAARADAAREDAAEPDAIGADAVADASAPGPDAAGGDATGGDAAWPDATSVADAAGAIDAPPAPIDATPPVLWDGTYQIAIVYANPPACTFPPNVVLSGIDADGYGVAAWTGGGAGPADIYFPDAEPEQIRFGAIYTGPKTFPAWVGTRGADGKILSELFVASDACAYGLSMTRTE